MTDKEKEELLEKYKLSQEKHDDIYNIIKRVWTFDKIPSSDKIAVIIGGQTGAGKSGIISYSQKMFKDGNVVIINSDEIKPFHPKAEEIAKLYPELYTEITDQESNTWTSRLFEETRKEGYNIIFEGTMKNNRIADESITKLRDELGYTVIVRGLSVCDLESRMSILERYEEQVSKKGWGRMVVPEHHNKTYLGMPNTIEYIERTGKYDILEIFRRGENVGEPVLVYSKHNPATQKETKRKIDNNNFVSQCTQLNKHINGYQAIFDGREEDYQRILDTYPERLQNIRRMLIKRENELNEKLLKATTDMERKNLQYMLSQLQEEKRQTLELLKTYEVKKKIMVQQTKSKVGISWRKVMEFSSMPLSTDDDDAR